MFQLKNISKDSIPAALEKEERYRLLNEPGLAESICLDILEVDPQNDNELNYYAGIISERKGMAILKRSMSGQIAVYEWLHEAMEFFEKAESIRPSGNDDAILRWNTCARLITSNSQLTPHVESAYEPALED